MNKAILVIDVQLFFINRFTKEIPKKIAQLINRNIFNKVYFFKFVNNRQSNWYKAGWKRMMDSSETDIVPELKHFSNDKNTFTKNSYSVFRVKEFNKILKEEKITKLFICGLDTHACIYTSAHEAYERGYDVKVISDLCAASHGKKYHLFALDLFGKNMGDNVLITSKNIT